jgi:chemotaxis response regulator CheB
VAVTLQTIATAILNKSFVLFPVLAGYWQLLLLNKIFYEPSALLHNRYWSLRGRYNSPKIFFENIGDKPGTAFIIIQHLAPNQNGFTKEAIKGSTNLPITQVKERVNVEKNQIYLIPPPYFLLMEDQHLILKPRDTDKKVNDAIDVFFCSLAQQLAETAIGIIFSGLGSDGAKGVQIIKERGGITMVQSPDSANFSSMPGGNYVGPS